MNINSNHPVRAKKLRKRRPTKVTSAKKNTAPIRKKLLSPEAYELTMQQIDQLMKIGEDKLTSAQAKRLRALAKMAEHYEDINYPIPVPSCFQDIVKLKLFEMGINQTYAATLLGISNAKFSLIMNGKQRPDIYFLKAIHDKLKVDANLILDVM
jgi:antitoxin component HigA of HigAB toxin-antitoxin module